MAASTISAGACLCLPWQLGHKRRQRGRRFGGLGLFARIATAARNSNRNNYFVTQAQYSFFGCIYLSDRMLLSTPAANALRAIRSPSAMRPIAHAGVRHCAARRCRGARAALITPAAQPRCRQRGVPARAAAVNATARPPLPARPACFPTAPRQPAAAASRAAAPRRRTRIRAPTHIQRPIRRVLRIPSSKCSLLKTSQRARPPPPPPPTPSRASLQLTHASGFRPHFPTPTPPPPAGTRKEVTAGGKQILLFYYRDSLFAIESRSPAEGAYSEGFATARFTQDGCIICPVTSSTFDIKTGEAGCETTRATRGGWRADAGWGAGPAAGPARARCFASGGRESGNLPRGLQIRDWYPTNGVLRMLTPKDSCRPMEVFPVKARVFLLGFPSPPLTPCALRRGARLPAPPSPRPYPQALPPPDPSPPAA